MRHPRTAVGDGRFGRYGVQQRILQGLRWTGLIVCALAALGQLVAQRYDMAGLMLALAVVCAINVDRQRRRPPR